MKILFVVSSYPYPMNSGTKMRTHSFINALADGNELYLLSAEDPINLQAKTPFKEQWLISPIKKSTQKRKNRLESLKLMLRRHSWEIDTFNDEFTANLLRIINDNKFDLIFCRYMGTAKYLIENRDRVTCPIVVDLDDIEPIKKRRSIEREFSRKSFAYYRSLFDNYIFSQYHKKLKQVNRCFVCSPKDAQYILKKNGVKMQKLSQIP